MELRQLYAVLLVAGVLGGVGQAMAMEFEVTGKLHVAPVLVDCACHQLCGACLPCGPCTVKMPQLKCSGPLLLLNMLQYRCCHRPRL